MSDMMRTARVLEPGGLFQIEELAMPQPAEDAWLVEVVAAAVRPDLRSSLLDEASSLSGPVMTLAPCAWDITGRVVGGGARHPDLMHGRRVLVCRSVSQSRQEGFPEYLALSSGGLFALDEDISDLHALCLGPLGQGLRVLREVGFQAGDCLRLQALQPAQAVVATVAALALEASCVWVTASDEVWAQKLRAAHGERVCTAPALVAGESPGVAMTRCLTLTAASFAGVAVKEQDLTDMQVWAREEQVDLSLYEHEVFDLSEINLALDVHEQCAQGWANAAILY